MGRELGRISGPLLADNLLRNGANLAFDNKVLYLDVVNGWVGFNTLAPTTDLTVPTTIQTTGAVADYNAFIGDFIVSNNVIQHVTGGITLQPDQVSNPNFVTPGLSTANLYFSKDNLTNKVSNDNINIAPAGTGQIKLNSNTLVSIKNLESYSQDFANAAWSKTSSTIAANVITAPDNTLTGSKLRETNATTFFGLVKNPTALQSTTYTYSIYARAAERNGIVISFTVVPNGYVGFNLLAGTIDTQLSGITNATITPAGDGWYRCTATFTTASSGSNLLYHLIAIWNNGVDQYTGTAGAGIYIWGAQLELGSKASTYVTTTTLSQPGLHATGNITFDGSIQLGDSINDRITFAAEVTSNIIPAPATTASNLLTQRGTLFIGIDDELLLISQKYLYNLGSPSLKWNTLYSNTLTSPNVNTSTITVSSVTAGGTTFGSNTINNTSNDIKFSTLGTGQVKFNNVAWIDNNNIQNTTNGAITLTSGGNGYIKFAGTSGMVLPVGNNNNRPINPATGAMRFNTNLGYAEIFNGSIWASVGGSSAVLSTAQVNDTMWAWDLILG
jgi:hypothetical protein